jgi:hypothetical protein
MPMEARPKFSPGGQTRRRALWPAGGKGEALFKHGNQLEIEMARQSSNLFLIFIDEFPSGFSMLSAHEAFAYGPDPSTDAIARFEHEHGGAIARQFDRGGETGQSRADDNHRLPSKT